MAVDPFPGAPDPAWDDFVDGHASPLEAAGAPAAPRVGELDIQALTAALVAAQRVVKDAAPEPAQHAGKVPDWAKSDTAKTSYWTVAVPTLVTGCANIAVHAYGPLWPSLCGGTATVIGTIAGIAGMNRSWPQGFNSVVLGLAVGGITWTTAATGSGWVDFFAWLGGTAAALGFKLMYERNNAGHRLDLEEKREDIRLKQARTRTETFRGDAIAAQSQVKTALDLARLQTLMQQEQAPYLGGSTGEERALREAFWQVFSEQVLTCEVTSTLSGWKATVGLSKLSRKEARTGWDKIQTAMRADGRFIVSEGRVTNELLVKFVSSHAATGVRTAWTADVMPPPEGLMVSLGTDTETGEEVLIRFDERLLITGASGTGKSWSTRPLMAHAHLRGELILIDGKGEEANVWDGICRCATDTPEVVDAIEYAHDVMTSRKSEMRARGLSVWDGRQLTVNIDEGQVILAVIAGLKKGKDDLLQKLIELSSLGRSRGVVLWWQTQYGVTSGDAPGIHKMIAPNMLQRFSLRVANGTHAQVALDDCAYYEPQSIPDDRAFRGHGFLKGYGPVLIRTWTMDDNAVRELPAAAVDTATPAFGASPEDKVRAFLTANPGATQRATAEATGVSLGKVNAIIKSL
jgi:hypothetical protein